MKFTITQENLKAGLDLVKHAVTNESSMLATNCVHLGLEDGRPLRITANNLAVMAVADVACVHEESGYTAVEHKTLSAVAAAAPEGVPLTVEVDPQTWHLTVTAPATEETTPFTVTIFAQSPDGFPDVPPSVVKEPQRVQMSAAGVETLVRQAGYAVSQKEDRPTLTGMQLIFEDGRLTARATDGYRLALHEGEYSSDGEWTGIVPPRPLAVAARANRLKATADPSDDPITLSYSRNGSTVLLIETAGLTQYVSLLDGTYPEVSGVIPRNTPTKLVIDRQMLIDNLSIGWNICKSNKGLYVLFSRHGSAHGEYLQLHMQDMDHGEHKGLVPLSSQSELGGFKDFAVSPQFLLDTLRSFAAPMVCIRYSSPMEPILVEPVGDEQSRAVIMPMHFERPTTPPPPALERDDTPATAEAPTNDETQAAAESPAADEPEVLEGKVEPADDEPAVLEGEVEPVSNETPTAVEESIPAPAPVA